ncbi:MAG: DEAD/DEAH box helicase family protein [Bacteroidaceae bacterium]|nr:DEAD/DEAH box helicase family protein [Bacteroidaceae bacterium]
MEDASKSPILNNPYEEPLYHYGSTDGNLDYNTILDGRRPFSMDIGITPNTNTQRKMFDDSAFYDEDADAEFINGIRAEIKKWREAGYPNTTRVTRELLNYWFNNKERAFNMRLFFCQREAVETAVYLNEVADRDPNKGRYLLHLLHERQHSVSSLEEDVLPRTAFKMATGTGKTVVMAMLILYNYINKKVNIQDTRFADHFLIVAPGITIRDRLGVLRIDESTKQSNMKNDYYYLRGLIPYNYERLFEGINSCITITNYHTFEPKVFSGKKASPMDGKLVYKDGEMIKQQEKEDFSVVLSRVLGKGMKGKRLLVINDEAHHCYLPKKDDAKRDDEVKETEEENEKAMVWYEGLRQMKKLGYKLQHIYDLSATPYYLKGSGYPEYSLFPWVVSDFGLVDAIESGLVKIPFLPSYDNTHDLDEPKLRNIYKHISKQLPKKGQKTIRKEKNADGKEIKKEFEAAPHLPALLNSALDQFVKDYESYTQELGQMGEMAAELFSTPPVLIVVCNNTTVSKEVYKYIAGYKKDEDENGNPINVAGMFDVFSNYTREGLPVRKAPTLLIDSSQLEQAGAVVDEEFKTMFREEISNFKREYAILHGAGSADKLADGDILREVVNTVGKPGKLGAHIKCVVSVSMLTEGWDANTVTHVCGIRAFGSQLLCEQVAGRALRRCSYDLRPYDKDGNEIAIKNLKRYKEENIVYKFPPEYARIIGVPFKTFKSGGTAKPQPQQPKVLVQALKDREDMEIVFPNVRGYRIETIEGKITADFTDVPKFKMDFAKEVAYKTFMQNAIERGAIKMENDPEEWRDSEIIYYLTQQLISQKYNDRENGRQFQKFLKLKKIVEYWYANQIEVIGNPNDKVPMKRLVKLWDSNKVVANIYEGIKNGSVAADETNVSAILDYYNPKGSSHHVFGKTSKEVYPTQKSHVNYVVADTDSWEQICAKTLEQLPQVEHYVKNSFLGFKIPYVVEGEEHDYITDFIAVCKAPDGRKVNLIIEISGFSNDRTGNKDAKRFYTQNYWIPAVNNLKEYGEWAFIEITDIDNIESALTKKINEL